MRAQSLGCLWLIATPWIVAHQASLCPWNLPGKNTGVPFPSLGDLADPQIKPASPALAGGFFTTEPPGEVKVAQSCLTLCDPMDCSPPGSSVHGILHTRILEWVAVPFSRESSQPRDRAQPSGKPILINKEASLLI